MFAILLDPVYEKHETGSHPERPARLQAIRDGLATFPGLKTTPLLPQIADIATIARVHDEAYIRSTQQRIADGAQRLDMDTAVCSASFDVALKAVGGSIAGVDQIMAGTLKQAFFAIRPPGHHAERGQAMGFCLFNNVAIAAAHLVHKHKLDRVAIFDFDVHHGNGTMHSFYEDPAVFYSSIHQWPLYPGTGREDETGAGRGLGTTLNFPRPAGSGDDEYEEAVRLFSKAMDKYKPQFLLVSAGFDGHWSDPLAGHQVTERGYVRVANLLADIAATYANGRMAMFLEGGYDLAALKNCVAAVVKTLAERM